MVRAALTVLLVAMLSVASFADATYTSTMTFSQANRHVQLTMKTYIKGHSERTERSMHMGPVKMTTVTLTLCDRDQVVDIDPDLKIYVPFPMGPHASAGRTANGRPRAYHAKPGTGTVHNDFKVKDLGAETVAGFKARHYKITMHNVSKGCCGDYDHTMVMEIWTSHRMPGFFCPRQRGWKSYSLPTQSNNPCKVKVTNSGDFSAMAKAMSGAIVKEIIYNDGKPMAVQQLVHYSDAPLSGSLFSLKGYHKVSMQEFQQQRMTKMMKQFHR